jgi:hypothetical protein
MTKSTKKNHHLIEKRVDFDDGVARQGPNLLMYAFLISLILVVLQF